MGEIGVSEKHRVGEGRESHGAGGGRTMSGLGSHVARGCLQLHVERLSVALTEAGTWEQNLCPG